VHKQGSTSVSLVQHLDKNSSCHILLNRSNWTYTCFCYCSTRGYVKVKVKQSRYRPGVAQRVPGS